MTEATLTAPARVDAWRQLGTPLDGVFDAQSALERANLANWNVRKTPIQTVEGQLQIDNRFATIYTDPRTQENKYLGVVGSHYEPIQNETHVDLLNAIVDQSGGNFDAAGIGRKGRDTFVSMSVPREIKIGGFDAIDLQLVAFNSHDASSAFRFMITPIRVSCTNMQAVALKNAVASFSIRHVRGAQGHVQEAREALGLTFDYIDEFEIAANRMIEQEIADKQFEKIVARLFDADKAVSTRQQNTAAEHMSGVMSLWKGDSSTMTSIKGTRWGAYQAVTEYADHFMSVRGKGDASLARASRTATSSPLRQLKQDAFTLIGAAR